MIKCSAQDGRWLCQQAAEYRDLHTGARLCRFHMTREARRFRPEEAARRFVSLIMARRG